MSRIDQDEYMSQIGSEVEEGMEWTQGVPDSSGITNWAFPIAPEMPHSSGVAQRRPWPVGQFTTRAVKPILPFLTTLYLRAQLIHQLARNVHVFHMQSIYIARQALHLAILLNDAVDASEGPSDEQDDERNDLEDDLIELSKAMTEWGSDKGDDFEYESQATEIERQYTQLFKERFYFHDARDRSTDTVYQKFVDYDAKTIRYRQRREIHINSPTTIEIKYWTETIEDESGSEDDTGRRFDSNIGSLPARLRQHTVEGLPISELRPSMPVSRPGGDAQLAWLEGAEGLARKLSRLSPKSRGMVKKDHRKKNRAVAAFRIHLAINQLHMVQLGTRRLVRRDSRRWRVSSLPSRSMSLTLPASSVSMLLASPTTPPNTAMISPSSPPIPGTLPVSSPHSVPENSSESAGPQGVLLSTFEDLMEVRKERELAGKVAIWGEPESTATHTTTDLGDLEITQMSSPDSVVVEPGSRMNLNLLSLDAGGPQGISQLMVLKNVMESISFSSGDDSGGTLRRPCEVFHVIGGVGTGGIIAMFLVVLKMTAVQALEEFTDLVGLVFKEGVPDCHEQTEKLKRAIEGILERHSVDKSMELIPSSQPLPTCKLVVPIMYKNNVGVPCVLRNYIAGHGPPTNPTIAEAMLATCAAPPIFTPTSIYQDFGDFNYIGGDVGFDSRPLDFDNRPLGFDPSAFGGKSNGRSTDSGDANESLLSSTGSSGGSNHELIQHWAPENQDSTTSEMSEALWSTFNTTPGGPVNTCGYRDESGVLCGKTIPRQDRFKYHVQAHFGVKPYACADSNKVVPELKCNRRFSSPAERDTHIRNKVPLVCNCTKEIKPRNLARHQKICPMSLDRAIPATTRAQSADMTSSSV